MDFAAIRVTVLAFDDSKGTKAGHAVADRGGMEYVHNLVDILVSVGLLFLQPSPATSTGNNAPLGEFLHDGPPAARPDRGPTRHPSPRTVA